MTPSSSSAAVVSVLPPRSMPAGEEERYRTFLRATFASLAEAPLHSSRVCLYGDTFDGAF